MQKITAIFLIGLLTACSIKSLPGVDDTLVRLKTHAAETIVVIYNHSQYAPA